jgi:hypothetical protein
MMSDLTDWLIVKRGDAPPKARPTFPRIAASLRSSQ